MVRHEARIDGANRVKAPRGGVDDAGALTPERNTRPAIEWVIPEIGWYAVSRALPAALGFATVILLVRLLGPRQYGYLAITQAAANGASVIASGWLTQGLLRFIPALGPQGGRALGSIVVPSGVALAAGIGLTVPILILLAEPWSSLDSLALGALLVSGFSAHAVVSAVLQAKLLPRSVAEIELVRAVGALALAAVACSWFETGFLGAVAAVGLSMVISAGWGARRICRSVAGTPDAGETPAPPSLRQLLGFGAPMSAWLGLSLAFPFVDRTVIERTLNVEAAGTYSAVYDVSFRACAFLLMPVVLALHPRVMRARHREGTLGARRLIALGMRLQLAISVVVLILVSLLAPLLLELTLGETADGARNTVVLLCAAGCVWHVALVAHKPLEAEKETSTMLLLMIVSLIITIVGNVVGVPQYGLPAAAWSSLVAGTFYTLGAVVLGARAGSTTACDSSPPR